MQHMAPSFPSRCREMIRPTANDAAKLVLQEILSQIAPPMPKLSGEGERSRAELQKGEVVCPCRPAVK